MAAAFLNEDNNSFLLMPAFSFIVKSDFYSYAWLFSSGNVVKKKVGIVSNKASISKCQS